MKIRPPRTRLQKLARKGFRGYPVATVAFYGPDDEHATKMVVGIVMEEEGDVVALERWVTESDVRRDPKLADELVRFIRKHEVRSVATTDRIIGCPHEEGKDYPEGEVCPACPFWRDRDRFTGERIR